MPTYTNRQLKIEQLDRRMQPFRKALEESPTPRKGWIHTIRTALGMPQEELARRMGINRSRVSQIEHAEVDGSLTLATFQKAAKALDGRLVLGVVTENTLERIIEEQAEHVAQRTVEDVNQTMALEDQATSGSHQEAERKRLKEELLRGSWRKLWQ